MLWGRRSDEGGAVTRPRLLDADAGTDDRLLAGVAAGDRHALAAIFDRHGAAVWALARTLAPEDADAVVQAVFVRLWVCAGRLVASATPVRPWLAMMTHRCVTRLGCAKPPSGAEAWAPGAIAAVALAATDVPFATLAESMRADARTLQGMLGPGLALLGDAGGLTADRKFADQPSSAGGIGSELRRRWVGAKRRS